MATAFMGYVLPWGQMSFWGATVITGLFSAIPLDRRRHPDLAARRAGGRQPDAEPLLLAALPPAVRDRRAGHRPHLGVPHHRQQQPDRRRGAAHLEGRGREGHAAVLALLRDQGPVRAGLRAGDLRGDRRLHAELPRPPRQLHRGRPAEDAGAHRARMVLPAVLRDAARDHLRHPLDQLEARRRARRCSARSRCCCSCRGSTPAGCARGATGRCSRSGSGCWSSTSWC